MNNMRVRQRFRGGSRLGVIPMGSEFIIILAFLFSMLFILSISLSFTNASELSAFTTILNDVAKSDPGVSASLQTYWQKLTLP